MPDVRKELQRLVEQTRELHAQERKITLASVELVGELGLGRNAPVNLGMSAESFARYIGLSPDQYYKRLQAARVLRRFPQAREMIMKGETEVSQLGLLAPMITAANAKIVLDGIKGLSKRDVLLFRSRVTCDGNVLPEKKGQIEIKLTLTADQFRLLERAVEVMAHSGHNPTNAEVIVKALDALLERRDPMRAAMRAQARATAKGDATVPAPGQGREESKASARSNSSGRPAIPAAMKHALFLRDKAQCSWIFQDGSRCEERGHLEIDHLKLWCRTKEHRLEHMALRCRRHNQQAAVEELGPEFIESWRWRREGTRGTPSVMEQSITEVL